VIHFADALLRVSALYRPIHGVIAHSFGTAGVTAALSRGFVSERVVFVAPVAHFQTFWDRFCDGLGISEEVWARTVAWAEAWLDVRFADVIPLNLAPKMSAPMLVLHDADDREVLIEDGVALAAAWPGAKVRKSERLGHNRILRDPATIAAAVSFLGG
jgi:pimeloyl-ACP methyl ester carboxylesterase